MTKSKFSAQDSGTWLPALTQSAPDSCGPLSQCVCVVGCIHPRSTDPETSCSHAHLLSRPPPQVAPGTCAGQQGLDAPTVTESVAEPSQERTSPESEVLHGRLCLRSLGPVPGFWPGGRGGAVAARGGLTVISTTSRSASLRAQTLLLLKNFLSMICLSVRVPLLYCPYFRC